MSTILVNTLTGTSTAGSIAVTGEGNSTTTNLQQGLAKVWVTKAADGASMPDSFNVSSLDDDGTGDFGVNFSSAMNNSSYAITTGADDAASDTAVTACNSANGGYATGSAEFEVVYINATSARTNHDIYCFVAFHGDLA